MLITKLSIADLRVIEQMVLEPSAGVNFIVGGNGAGKTSLLEAIYLAGRGRTFRHVSAGPMIRRGTEWTVVRVHLSEGGDDAARILGVRRGKRTFDCRLDNSDVRKRSTLAEALPVQWVGSQPQQFLERGPELRRRFFDMGLFHVEHDYLRTYAELNRTLKQRNAALKSGDRDGVTAWSPPFSKAAIALDEQRRGFIADLMEATTRLLRTWDLGFEITYRYRRGWRAESEISEELARKLDFDLANGFTSVGPQRAEIEVLSDGVVAEKTLSRGQQKMLVIALNLAMIDMMRERRRTAPVILVDDLGAELDLSNQRRILVAIAERGVQGFISAIQLPDYEKPIAARVFHVEHGHLQE